MLIVKLQHVIEFEMNASSKNQSLPDLFREVGEAISIWAAVEIQLHLIFGISLSLTAMQPGGGWSGTSTGPSAVLDAVEGFRAKMRMISAALSDALSSDGEMSAEGSEIMSLWGKLADRTDRLSKCRNKLAHWTVASNIGIADKPRVGLIPPSYTQAYHAYDSGKIGAATESDISGWKDSFHDLSLKLSELAERLAGHRELQYKLLRQTASQCLVCLPQDPTLLEYLERQLSTRG